MKFEANVVYPDGRVREVANLGYMLRNWRQIVSIQVSSFEAESKGESRPFCDAFMSVDFGDGRIYTTGFMDKGLLHQWLDRPVLRGLTCNWFGVDETIGADRPISGKACLNLMKGKGE